ncbi:hypothetical protein V4V57_004029 [Vibrio mimicus]
MRQNIGEIGLKLNKNLLADQWSSEYTEDYKSCLNARGMYDSMQFVLRLRPDLHWLLERVESGIVTSKQYDFETIQAFSTYLHETVHWWQHIGSTSGFILSLSYPSQAHINHKELHDFLKFTGAVKPIKRFNEINSKHFNPQTDEFKTTNVILNNFHDIEYFKYRVIVPKTAFEFSKEPLFESIGHSFHIAYSSFINLISATVDKKLEFLPDAKNWHIGFGKLRDNKVQGYYYGSDIGLPPVGLKDIYEGQARFTQIHYLYFASGCTLTWSDFESLGMLSGVYYSAFSVFLDLTGSERPESLDHPLIALYLLVLDIAMNPGQGFPFEIENYELFVESVDPGTRFIRLCRVIATRYPDYKTFITDYSSSEYFEVSTKLSQAIGSETPIDISTEVSGWAESRNSLIELMEEEKSFSFSKENQPIRLMLSRFIKYQQDKVKNPAYFCWPGVYCAGDKLTEHSMRTFNEHQALFTDKADGDIYPRIFPDKEEQLVQDAFNTFYSWIVTYDLCRQWIVTKGDFDYDYWWLTSKYSMDELEDWASKHFEFSYGVKPQDFKILD